MARQILPLAGQIIGGMVGGPVGAAIGGAIGGAVGQYVDPIRHQGPKLGEARAQTAQEGVYRPLVFGTGCVAGNVIHRSPRKVVRHRESVGKGNRDTVDSDRGYRTFAIRICEGQVAGLLRIWENETLVYDMRSESEIPSESVEYAEKFRFYRGTEDQLPDPDLEAYLGVGNVNSYRGSCYIVFGNFDLTDYGDMIPQYRFEVVGDGGELSVGSAAAGPVPLPQTGSSEGPTMAADVSNRIHILSGSTRIPNNQAGNWGYMWCREGDSYRVIDYAGDFSDPNETLIENHGITPFDPNTLDDRIWPHAITADGYALSSAGNYSGLPLLKDGVMQAALIPFPGYPNEWFYAPGWYSGYDGNGSAWIVGDSVYYGLRQFNGGTSELQALANRIYRWPLDGTGSVPADNVLQVLPWNAAGGPLFRYSISRQQKVYVLDYVNETLTRYDKDFSNPTGMTIPAAILSNLDRVRNVAVDETAGMMAFAYLTPGTNRENMYIADLSGTPLVDRQIYGSSLPSNTKILFTGTHIYVQRANRFFRVEYSIGGNITLGQIVEWCHVRVGQGDSQYDVSELDDVVDGVVFADGYSARDAITTLIPIYNTDASEHDRGSGYRINYIKRGAPVLRTLTVEGLVDEPEQTVREDPMDRPRVLHMAFESPVTGYTAGKASIQRISPDVKLVNEVSTYVPVTFNNVDEAWQRADVQMRVAWTEVHGERTFSIADDQLDIVPSDVIALSLRGQLQRLRILKVEYAAGVMKMEAVADRQSNYTSHVTGIPLPSPEPPPPSLMGPAALAILDIPAISDQHDRLGYYVAVSGTTEAYAGAVIQRQQNGEWADVISLNRGQRAIMGVLEDVVPAASQHYTDTTNTVSVNLHMEDELESLSQSQWLNKGGAFALETASGWEIMQYRDVEQDSNGVWHLTHLARGRLNTEPDDHLPGARFVLLDGVHFINADVGMIGESLTLRAAAVGRSPETAASETITYQGNSQREFPCAHLAAEIDSDGLSLVCVPRDRFGTEQHPVRSINHDGFRWTATDGSETITADTDATSASLDASGLSLPITVTVAQLNRFTGAGPEISEQIE